MTNPNTDEAAVVITEQFYERRGRLRSIQNGLVFLAGAADVNCRARDTHREITNQINAALIDIEEGRAQLTAATRRADDLAIALKATAQAAAASATKAEQAERMLADERRRATDAEYMRSAFRNMLGPKALEVVECWEKQGMRRTHISWGPEAHKLTGEERAQVLLDFEKAPRTRIDNIDADTPTIRSAASWEQG